MKLTIESVLKALNINLPEDILAACRLLDLHFEELDRALDRLAVAIPRITLKEYADAMNRIQEKEVALLKEKENFLSMISSWAEK